MPCAWWKLRGFEPLTLVDEFRVMIDPVVVGGGKRLFPSVTADAHARPAGHAPSATDCEDPPALLNDGVAPRRCKVVLRACEQRGRCPR